MLDVRNIAQTGQIRVLRWPEVRQLTGELGAVLSGTMALMESKYSNNPDRKNSTQIKHSF